MRRSARHRKVGAKSGGCRGGAPHLAVQRIWQEPSGGLRANSHFFNLLVHWQETYSSV